MPVPIESISPEGAFVVIGHVFAFAVDAFEGVRTRQALCSFESRRV